MCVCVGGYVSTKIQWNVKERENEETKATTLEWHEQNVDT